MTERLRFFDVNCRIGPDELALAGAPLDAASLERVLDAAGIGEALVYASVAQMYSPAEGNGQLAHLIDGSPRLHACWVLLPESTRELPDGVAKLMLGAGVRAARVFPARHRFSLAKWCCGPLLDDLAHAQIPLLIDYEVSHWSDRAVNYPEVEAVCSAHPTLPVVLCRVGVADDRYLYPLMQQLPNLYVDTSYYEVEGGIEEICDRFGARRLLFGTGLPVFAAGGPVCQLCYARISDAEKQLIAGGNLRALLGGVKA